MKNAATRRTVLFGFPALAAAGLLPAKSEAKKRIASSPLPRWGDQGDGTFVNPIIPADYSDIDAIRVGDAYYAISSTLHMSPGMVVLRSHDMVNWTTIGHAVADIDELGEEKLTWRRMDSYGRGVWAGAIRHHAGRFYIYFASPDSGLYVTTAARPEGPWNPVRSLWRVSGHNDPCPFWDEDGSAWLVMTRFEPDPISGKRYQISLYRMTADGLTIDPSSAILLHNSPGSEANKLYRIGPYYYHYFSEVRPEGRVPMMKRATKLRALAEAPAVQLGHVDAKIDREPNQGGLLEAPDGKWWFLTHQGHGEWEGRAMCLLPVIWQHGWPIIGRPGPDGIGNMVWASPKPIRSNRPRLPTFSDDFAGGIGPLWEWNHSPKTDSFSLVERPGWLRLKAFRPARQDFRGVGNVLTQRSWRTALNRASVLLDVSGMVDGQVAGLCHTSISSAWIGVKQENGRRRLCFASDGQIQMGADINAAVLALSTTWTSDGQASFAYGADSAHLQRFGGTYALKWGDYRGDRVGLFTYNNEYSSGHADFSNFAYNISRQEMNSPLTVWRPPRRFSLV